jgi:hypothetical protein
MTGRSRVFGPSLVCPPWIAMLKEPSPLKKYRILACRASNVAWSLAPESCPCSKLISRISFDSSRRWISKAGARAETGVRATVATVETGAGATVETGVGATGETGVEATVGTGFASTKAGTSGTAVMEAGVGIECRWTCWVVEWPSERIDCGTKRGESNGLLKGSTVSQIRGEIQEFGWVGPKFQFRVM